MDPTTTLELMREAQRDARWEDADEHAADLGEWLLRDGFHPADISTRELRYCIERAEQTGRAPWWAAA